MEEKKEYVFETPLKPEIEDLKEVVLDCSSFSKPEKAEALIKSLDLSVSDTIKERGDEGFIINPKMVLEGNTPRSYKDTVEKIKVILTKKEIKDISNYLKRKTEDKKIRDKIYYSIDKRVMKFYKWDSKTQTSSVVGNPKGEIKEALEWLLNNKIHGFSNTIYHLLSKEKADYVYCYKQAWLNKPIPNIQKWNERNDGEYMVLTESEADYRANEYLTDDDYLWKQAVESGNTTDSLEDWAEYILSMDGRESVLSGYDGNEEEETINGTTYCIYRTN
jgi:hypothetical protein